MGFVGSPRQAPGVSGTRLGVGKRWRSGRYGGIGRDWTVFPDHRTGLEPVDQDILTQGSECSLKSEQLYSKCLGIFLISFSKA